MPGTRMNQNALKHGGYCRVALGRMHPQLEPIRRKVFRLRQAFEAALVDNHDEISPLQAAHLHTAMVHETLAQVWERRVRDEYAAMTVEQLAVATDRISRERDRRDAALDKLGLEQAARTQALYRMADGRTLADLVFPKETPTQAQSEPTGAPEGSGEGSQ
jgi:hypothetical protein